MLAGKSANMLIVRLWLISRAIQFTSSSLKEVMFESLKVVKKYEVDIIK